MSASLFVVLSLGTANLRVHATECGSLLILHLGRRWWYMGKEMAIPTAEADQLTIVLIGNFNPAILQPRWMAGIDLLGAAEAQAAKITVIAADAAIFEVGDWLGVQATSDRFQAAGPFSHALKIRDFAVGLFSVLEHTPITQLAINRSMHFRLKDKTTRDIMGEKFAPAAVWPPALATAKLNSLRKVGKRPNSTAASLTVTIEPSARIPEVGVFISAHEHYELAAEERAAEVINSNFEASVRFGLEIAEMLLSA